ncbi:MAG: TrkA family potassium uptake protein [Dehalococcoidia bacterium]|nr:TrkA family potassium uptake protein [Dehalococcoidia bacterium]
MAKQAVVIGMGRFGVSLARELYQIGFDVLAIDSDEQVVQELSGQLSSVVQADSTSEAVLREMGIAKYDLAVVAIGTDIQASIMTTLLLKTLGVKEVIARANNPLHGQTLRRIGADRVVFPEQETGVRLAHTMFSPDVMEYMSIVPSFGISKIAAPEHLIGQSLEEAGLGGPRYRHSITVLAIRRSREPILFPAKEEVITPGDILFVACRDDRLERIRRRDAPPPISEASPSVN